MFRIVVSEEISHDRMPGTWPETMALAEVISRFISERSIPRGAQCIANYKLPETIPKAFPVRFHSPAPLGGVVAGLVQSGGEEMQNIGRRRKKRLVIVHIGSLLQSKRHELALVMNVRSNKPLRRKITNLSQSLGDSLWLRFFWSRRGGILLLPHEWQGQRNIGQ